MKKKFKVLTICFVVLLFAPLVLGQQPQVTMAFTVSMEQPTTHNYHVVFRCAGLKGELQDFKMPAFSPGFYRIMNFADNVSNFHAEDDASKPLPWEKTAKNTWRVACGHADSVTVSYDVKASGGGVAGCTLNESRGYISTTGVFMHVAGQLHRPVTVAIKPYEKWSTISTGLDPVEGKLNTFRAENFDVLYDCPIFMCNQEVISFEVQGIPHYVAMVNPGTFNRKEFTNDLARMITSAADIIGDIPYRHYTFIIMGRGGGGLEHLNSTALFTSVSGPENPARNMGWLSFVTHEYFHHYNVKRIRPIALGPFDYDRENYTNMLWVSEGFTVYYEYIILNRAGFLSRDEFLNRISSIIAKCENSPGHLIQSVADASYNAWTQSFFGSDQEVSYYDKGAILATLLDLKIRHESKNNKCLDDVMRTLYWKYYKEKNRGFTDAEFRAACELAAGCSLTEVFEYAYTTKKIDYPKYFSYTGLNIEMPREETERGTFRIRPMVNQNSLQASILKKWLKN